MVEVAASSPIAIPQEVNGKNRIPVRNLWLLMLYASDLFRGLNPERTSVEENPDDIPDLVAEILSHLVEKRLKRNLSYGFRRHEAILNRVRGRIDLLSTERNQLLERGLVACRFEDLTIDTPRNRFVRAALEAISKIVRRPELAHRCRYMGKSLKHLGVSGAKPAWSELSVDRFNRMDKEDRFMIAAAKLAFNLVLPSEILGEKYLGTPERELTWLRRLFEKGVGGFYEIVLPMEGWSVRTGKTVDWQTERESPGIGKILPSMQMDIVLEHPDAGKRIVIDTKFTSILTSGWYREESLKSANIYQIYAYLRSQEGNEDPLTQNAAGILLYPAIGNMVDESAIIQGHTLRFATVDLGATALEIRRQLIQLVRTSQ